MKTKNFLCLGAILWWIVYLISLVDTPTDMYMFLSQFWLLSALTYKE